MKVLLINTSEHTGGAAVAASRLMGALQQNGVQAKMLVRDRSTSNPNVVSLPQSWKLKAKFIAERLVIWMHNHFKKENLFAVDIANIGTDITHFPEFKEADVIHLHWVNQGFLSLGNLQRIFASGKPIVWTMHDMWPCTGICHHARTCTSYHTHCHHCMYLYKGGSNDLSTRTFERKKIIYKHAQLTFVTCSNWLKAEAEKSDLLIDKRIVSIPNPLNTALFHPSSKEEAREKLGLPAKRRLILFGSVKITDKRKGFDYLVEACRLLASQHPELKEEIGVVVFGHNSEELKPLLPFEVFPLNYIAEEREMVNVYNAVDLYVTPSLEENLPNTIMEAMACGVPCLGFQIGGIPEMIDHLRNGYVATYRSANDFAKGIYWILKESDYLSLYTEAVHKVETHYSEGNVAQKYIDLYSKLLLEKQQ